MSKKSASDKYLISQSKHSGPDTDDNVSLYGKVSALAPSDNATDLSSYELRGQGVPSDAGQGQAHAHQGSAPTAMQAGTVSANAVMTASTSNTIAALTSLTSVSKVYQHWADGDAARGTTAEWNNNILSDGKSDYFEGEVVPHVYIYKASNNTPLVNGETYTFNVTYNYYQANSNAGGFVYMTSPNIDRSPSSFTGVGEQADSTFINHGGMQGQFGTLNANVTAVSDVTYIGKLGSSIDAKVTISFVYTGPTTTSGGAEIEYGLKIARPGDVPDQGMGITDGANAWTGGSLQTTVDINGTGATSIQLAPSAIIVGEISGMKFSDVDGNGVRDADGADNVLGTADDESGLANWKIFLDKNNDGQWEDGEVFAITDASGKYSFSVVPDSDRSDPDNDPYIVREVQQSGWVQTTANPTPILITATDPTEANVNFGNMQQKPSLNIVKEATIDGGSADHAGEVISYTIAVQNTGNQTLTGVTVNDPFISNLTLVADAATADNELDVGETWHYTASHTVTQAEIDAGGNIVNTATADSDQTGPDTDDASIPVAQAPSLNIVKEATIDGGSADHAGEVISYTIAVQNTGNQTLTGVTVNDPFISNLTLVADAATADNELDVGETWHYTASHTVTLSEMDSGADIVNTATADSDQTGPDTDDASIPVQQLASMAIDKAVASISGGNGNGSLDAVNDVVNYAVMVSNTGNITLHNVTVTDPMTGLSVSDVTLVPGASETYQTSYTLTQADLDSNAGGDGIIENTAYATSFEAAPVSDTEQVNLFASKALSIDKKLTGISDGNGNEVADAMGDVLHYSVTVANLSTLTLTNVSVVDPKSGLNQSGLTLAPGQSETYLTSYTLTQSDLNDNGGGDGYIDNTATADSDQTDSISDTEFTALLRTVGLGVEKSVTEISGGNMFADAAGEIITYAIKVYNPGSVTLTGLTVTDELTGMSESLASLAPGQTVNYTTHYTLTQADLDNNGGGDGRLENVTVADSDQTSPTTDDETVQLLAMPVLFLNKMFLNVSGGNGNNLVDAVGDQLHYQIVVANPGNVTLTDLSVYESMTGLDQSNLTLAPDGVLAYTTTYTVTQADLDNNGGGDGYIDNIAYADSAQTLQVSDSESVPILRNIGMSIDKAFTSVSGGNANGVADFAGDILNYSFTVKNLGNVTLTNVVITDALTGLNASLTSLAPGASQSYTSTYTLLQSDLDTNGGGDGRIENTATVSSNETGVLQDTEAASLIYKAQVDLTKYVSVDQGSTWQDANIPTGPTLLATAGYNPLFKYTALNNGSVTLKDVILTDSAYDLNGIDAGTTKNLGDLAPGQLAEFIFEAPFTAGQNSGDAVVTATALTPVMDIDNAYYLGV
ncbi:MAG: DUF11 domain-containing protein [Limnohabitans sp.]|nr:DUF11 domain-containing protein [Limnohabitans sp.]